MGVTHNLVSTPGHRFALDGQGIFSVTKVYFVCGTKVIALQILFKILGRF